MKKVIYLLLFFSAACGMSKEDVSSGVERSLQDNLSRNPRFQEYSPLHVVGVTLVSEGGLFSGCSETASYRGLALIEYEGTTHQISLDVVVDGDDVMWEVQPLSFLFLVQSRLRQNNAIY